MKFLETCNPNVISDDNYSLANHDRSRHQVTFTFNCGKRPHKLKIVSNIHRHYEIKT